MPTNVETSRSDQAALLCVNQVAALLQVSVRSVWRLRSAGELIEPVQIGGNTRWRRAELERWIAEGCPPISASEE